MKTDLPRWGEDALGMRALDCRCEENDGNEALDKAGIAVEKRALPFLALTALRVMRVTPREENIVDVGDNDERRRLIKL